MIGRGGGTGGGGRGRRPSSSSRPPRPINYPSFGSANTAGNRMSKLESPSSASLKTTPEERFSLESADISLVFTSLIRLAPNIIEEIKGVEAQGGMARIKFDSNGNNPAGNVIEVGEKVYRFIWSPDAGELCDIYEECRSVEGGGGLLRKRGCAWRKIIVRRVLDEATMNRVRMRSEEAERKHKSRRTIILEQRDPYLKSQAKATAAVEGNHWRTDFKKKDFRKRSVDPFTGPSKSVQKCISATSSLKGRHSTSPLPCSRHLDKENITSFEKDSPRKIVSGVEQGGHSGSQSLNVCDLQSTLTTILKGKPMGMSLKALERAVGDAIPNLKSIIEKVATFQPPDRYVLKAKNNSESFSEQQGRRNHPQDYNYLGPSIDGNKNQETPEETVRNEVLEKNSEEQLNHQRVEPTYADLFSETKHSENSEGLEISPTGCESESSKSRSDCESVGASSSDSESESSDSGSDSESVSASSSDSESDATINSKQPSDEYVDIMACDDDSPKPNISGEFLKSKQVSDEYVDISNGSPNRNLVENRHDGNVGVPASEEVEDIDIVSISPGTGSVIVDGMSSVPNSNIFGQKDKMIDHCSPKNLHKDKMEQVVDFKSGDEQSSKTVKQEGLAYAKGTVYTNTVCNKQILPNHVDLGASSLDDFTPVQGAVDHVVGGRASQMADNHNRVVGVASDKVQIPEQRFGLHGNLALQKDRDRHSHNISSQEGESGSMEKTHLKSLHRDRNGMNRHGKVLESEVPDHEHGEFNEPVDRVVRSKAPQMAENRNAVVEGASDKVQITERRFGLRENLPLLEDRNRCTEVSKQEGESGSMKSPYRNGSDRHGKVLERELPDRKRTVDNITRPRVPQMAEIHNRAVEGARNEAQISERRSGLHENSPLLKDKERHSDNISKQQGESWGMATPHFKSPYHGTSVMNQPGKVLEREVPDRDLGEFNEKEGVGARKQLCKGSFRQTERSIPKSLRECMGSGVHRKTSRKLEQTEHHGAMQVVGFTESEKMNRRQRVDAEKKPGSKQGSTSEDQNKKEYDASADLSNGKKMSLAENSIDGQNHERGFGRDRKSKQTEQADGFIECGKMNRKRLADAEQILGNDRGSASSEDRKKQKYNHSADLNDLKNISLADKNINDQKHEKGSGTSTRAEQVEQPNGCIASGKMNRKRHADSEEVHGSKQGPDSCENHKKKKYDPPADFNDPKNTFSKYAKKDPDHKGPIVDHSQYQDYVQEYREKYASYTSLDKILESYRNRFSDLGRDLENDKHRNQERYLYVVGRLTELHRQCGAEHTRLKEIFVILHYELKQLKQRIKDYAASYSKA